MTVSFLWIILCTDFVVEYYGACVAGPSYIVYSCSLNFGCWFYFIRTHFYFVVAKQLDELIWNVWQCERDVCIGRKYFHISLAKLISSASHLNSGRERLCIRENNKYIIKWCYDDYY